MRDRRDVDDQRPRGADLKAVMQRPLGEQSTPDGRDRHRLARGADRERVRAQLGGALTSRTEALYCRQSAVVSLHHLDLWHNDALKIRPRSTPCCTTALRCTTSKAWQHNQG
jgi:hypothetical protein